MRKALNSAVVIQFPQDTAPIVAELADLTPEGGKKIAKAEGGMSLRTYFSIRLNHPQFDAEVMRILTGGHAEDDIERRLSELETRIARSGK